MIRNARLGSRRSTKSKIQRDIIKIIFVMPHRLTNKTKKGKPRKPPTKRTTQIDKKELPAVFQQTIYNTRSKSKRTDT